MRWECDAQIWEKRGTDVASLMVEDSKQRANAKGARPTRAALTRKERPSQAPSSSFVSLVTDARLSRLLDFS